MDLRTGKLYSSVEEARAAGVSESDLVQLQDSIENLNKLRDGIPLAKPPKLAFSKGSFKSIEQTVEK